MRQKEWWGNNTVDPANVDTLEVTTRSGGDVERAGNIINGATAPYAAQHDRRPQLRHQRRRRHRHERAVPARPVPLRRRRLHAGDRAARRHDHVPPRAAPDDDRSRCINTPNWSSEAGHGMTVTFRDWVQDSTPGASASRPGPAPAGSDRIRSADDRGERDGLRGGPGDGRSAVDSPRPAHPGAARRRRPSGVRADPVPPGPPHATSPRTAGVAAGTFYTYFDSKEEIFREVADEVLARAVPRRPPRSGQHRGRRGPRHRPRQPPLLPRLPAQRRRGSIDGAARRQRRGHRQVPAGHGEGRGRTGRTMDPPAPGRGASATTSSTRGRRRSRCTR